MPAKKKPSKIQFMRALARYIKKLAESDDFDLNTIDMDIANLAKMVLANVKDGK